MIFDAILTVLLGVFNGVLGLFPSFVPDFAGLGSGLGAGVAGANSLFPVTVLGVCMASLLGLRVFLFGLTFVTWIWAKIPFTFK